MTTTAGVVARPAWPDGLGSVVAGALAVVLLAASLAQVARVLEEPRPAAVPPIGVAPTAVAAAEGLAALPMGWSANTGQSDPRVRFRAQGLGYGAFLTDTEAVLRLEGAVVRLGFDEAAPRPVLRAEEALPGRYSRFVGTDADAWHANAATSARVRYSELWPGIDVTFRGTGTELEWDYHVAAGSDPTVAGVSVAGADEIDVDGDRATLVVGDDELGLAIPAVWQVVEDGTRIERAAEWRLDGDVLRVIPQDWDRALAGVIDPTLEWATYLGGGTGGEGNEEADGVAVDSSGNAYVTGVTSSSDFPTTAGVHDTTLGPPSDKFVVKMDPAGTLLYSTFIDGPIEWAYEERGIAVDSGGNAYITGAVAAGAPGFPATPGAYDTVAQDVEPYVVKLDADGDLVFGTLLGGTGGASGADIAVDGTGAVYVTGYTSGATPITPGAFDSTPNGESDAFVTKLDPTGSTLAYSTLLGAPRTDSGAGIAVDAAGQAFVTGRTQKPTLSDPPITFPVTPGAFDTTHNGNRDTFVTKIDAAGSSLVYSTLLGGTGNEDVGGVAITSDGSAFITGYATNSLADYPTTPGAFDTTPNGATNTTDAYVTKINPAGGSLAYSTFLAGADARDVAVDALGHAYVTGSAGAGFPITPGAFATAPNGGGAFVTKLDLTGSALAYSALVGGSGFETGHGIAVAGGEAVFVGGTTSSNFPTTPGALDTTFGSGAPNTSKNDGFVTRLSASGAALMFSTYLGGSDASQGDAVRDVAIDASGVYVTGTASSAAFPTTAGAFDTSRGGASDVFVSKLDPTGSTLLYSTFLGGPGADLSRDIAIDHGGNAYVTGAGASGYPTTAGAYAGTAGKGVFVTKLDPTGATLVYSTRFGGYLISDYSNSIAVDAAGSAYIAGTSSIVLNGEEDQIPYPTTPGAFDRSYNIVSWDQSGDTEAFVTKLNPAGSALDYSTFVGGLGFQSGTDVAVDGAGRAFLAGNVTEFFDDPPQGPGTIPTTPGSFDVTYNGGYDAFVVELNTSGSGVEFGTFLGGDADDFGRSIALGSGGAAYVTGSTGPGTSPFPTTAGAFDASENGSTDAFVTKVAPGGGSLAYSTRLGGTAEDEGAAIAVDGGGVAHVTGVTNAVGSEAFPTTADALDATLNGGTDAFVTKVAANGASLVYSGVMGGPGDDSGDAIVVNTSGRVVVGGNTVGDGFPTTSGAFDVANPGLTGAGFVSLVDFSPVLPPTPSGCVNSVMPSASISWYPAQPGGQSALEVACSFNDRPGASQVAAAYTIHDHRSAQYHNGGARSVVVGAALSGSGALTADPGIVGTGMAGWVNRVVSGPGLAPRTFVTSVDGDVLHLNRATVADIDAGTVVLVENAAGARSVDDASGGEASTVITSPSASFSAGDVGLSIAGTGIPLGATISAVNSPTEVVISAAATLVDPVVTIGATLLTTSARTVTGASTTSSTTVASSAAGFAASDVGLPVTGVCDQLTATGADDYPIPAGTFVLATPTATEATTTGGLAGGQTGCTLTIGEPNATAPQDGELAGQHTYQLDLNPVVVPGAGACAARQPEGLTVPARWYNPGSFHGTGISNTPPGPTTATPATPGTKVIGQLYFETSTVGYSAFVIERKAATPGDPIGVTHYDLQVPFVPIASVKCPGTTRSPGMTSSLAVHATTATQTTGPLGTGRPGTAQIRATLPSTTGGYTSTLYVRSDTPGITYSPATAFQRLCVYPTGNPNPIAYHCGN